MMDKGSLVQRELSAKLTEGLFYCSINIQADTIKVVHDFVIRNPKNRDAITL